MKERPILFSAPMVRAILSGRKTQTRRAIKPQPEVSEQGHLCGEWLRKPLDGLLLPKLQDITIHCPHGQPGDRLYVREAFAKREWFDEQAGLTRKEICYRENPRIGMRFPGVIRDVDDMTYLDDSTELEYHGFGWPIKWKPSIHMHRWASRITLEITGVRVERLQDISEADAKVEGVHSDDEFPTESDCLACFGQGVHGDVGPGLGWIEVDCKECDTAVKRFRNLWKSINGPDSWEQNPWVWAIEFQKVEAP